MAKKYEEVEKIEEIRNRISRLTEIIAQEKPIITTMKENPAATIIILLFVGVLTALVSRSVVKTLLSLVSVGLKLVAFFYFVKQGMSFFKKIKRI